MPDERVAPDAVDFALVAFHAEGQWRLDELADDVLSDVPTLAAALRRLSGEDGAVALIGIDEDFFVLARVDGSGTRLLLSDVTAAGEWELAESVVESLGLPQPEDDDDEEPAGDLALLADLGLPAREMGELIDDDELYPDEMLSEVARSLGFGELFDDAVGLTSA